MHIILIILGILFILFLGYLALSFFLLGKGLDSRDKDIQQFFNKNKYKDNTISYNYNYYKEHLVEEEKKAIDNLHNSAYYMSLSDKEKKDEDNKLHDILHINRESIEHMVQGKHTFIDNPFNI